LSLPGRRWEKRMQFEAGWPLKKGPPMYWRKAMFEFLNIAPVTELIDHIISKGNKVYENTQFKHTWVIGHDALSQLWEKGAVEYLALKGFDKTRMLGPQGDTNQNDAHYKDRPVGNSPEVMPLDNNLNADLVYGHSLHIAVTRHLDSRKPEEAKLKFHCGTPESTASSLKRTWEIYPSNERVAQDIRRHLKALDRIIEEEGAYVEEMDTRHGRRYHPDCDLTLKRRKVKHDAIEKAYREQVKAARRS